MPSLTRRRFLAASAAGLAAMPAYAGPPTPPRPAFRRGGAIHTMMNWAALRDDGSGRYLARPFEAPRNAFPAAFIADFAGSGFDFVRLTLDVGPFIQLQGDDREALETKLLDNIARFHAMGLGVIADCHPVEQVAAYSPQTILSDLDAPVFAGYTAMIGRLARRLADVRTGRVMLELMNEPAMANASHRLQVKVWGAAQIALHDAARRAAPDLPILLTGADYGGISGLTDLDPSPFRGSNVVYSFHYYMPLSFTHQGVDLGAGNTITSPYVVDLPYPYDAISPAGIRGAIKARIDADGKLDSSAKSAEWNRARVIVEGFLADAWNRHRVDADMARVAAWADANGIDRHRILMGECGVTRRDARFTGARPAFRRRWLSDVTTLAQSRGFNWALWEVDGKEFGIQSADDPDRLDASVVDALAMTG